MSVAAVTITCTEDGPLQVSGPIALMDHSGAVVTVPEGDDVWLCRCGASESKPFCDGSHATTGFRGALAV